MSAATTKVAIDKLVKIFEPLKDAQTMMADLEAAEQRLREVQSLTEGENNAVGLLKQEREKLENAVKRLRDNHDATVTLTQQKVADMIAKAQQDVKDIERAGQEAERLHQIQIEARTAELEKLSAAVDAKRAELEEVEAKIAAHREAIRKAVEAI